MEQKKTILTYAGLKKLEDELHDLKVNKPVSYTHLTLPTIA